MKIAFVIYRYFPYGGLQRDMAAAALNAVSRGHSVTVLCAEWESEEIPGVAVEILPTSGFTNHGRMLAFSRQVRERLGKSDFDRSLMFNRMGGGDFYFAADNCLLTGWRRSHSATARRLLPRYRTFLALEKAVMSPTSQTRIFALTKTQIADYRHCYGTPENRFILLPPGVMADFRRPAEAEAAAIRSAKRRELGIAEDALTLIQVAASFHTKGVDRACAAFAELKKIRPDARFLVVGPDRPLKRPGVDFLGGRTDVPALLLTADLMIHPARCEATGGVLTESLSAGTPPLTVATCGYAPLVADIAPELVLPEPFDQNSFNAALLATVGRLNEYKTRTACYGWSHDLGHRTSEIVDELEKGILL
ncbi:MAG: glycosyltransferase family 4 protein [Victivallaceae bacterium]|nr:glycosyltransferase family 4 protein [Victivallaceae bacterium]